MNAADFEQERQGLARRIDRLRQNVELCLTEADRRRQGLMNALDLERLRRRHPVVVIGVSGLALALAIGLPILAVARARDRRRLVRRIANLREALGRMARRPDRVADNPPHLPKRILGAALAAMARTVIKHLMSQVIRNGRASAAVSP